MNRRMLRSFGETRWVGVGGDPPTPKPIMGALAAGSFLLTGIFAGLRGHFLAGGLLVIASPFMYDKLANPVGAAQS